MDVQSGNVESPKLRIDWAHVPLHSESLESLHSEDATRIVMGNSIVEKIIANAKQLEMLLPSSDDFDLLNNFSAEEESSDDEL